MRDFEAVLKDALYEKNLDLKIKCNPIDGTTIVIETGRHDAIVQAAKAKEIYDSMASLLYDVDIPSPTVPEYIEHHIQIQNLMISLKQICGQE